LCRPGINGLSRIFLQSFFLFFFPLVPLSCAGTSQVLGISQDEAAVNFKNGDMSFIRQAQLPDDFPEAESRLKQLSVIHSAAPFYAGLLVGGSPNPNSLELLLFCAALESPSPPVRREAALKLVPLIFEIEDEKDVKDVHGFLGSSKFKDRAEIQTLIAACLYRLGRYDEAAKINLTQPASAKHNEWNRALSLFSSIKNASEKVNANASSNISQEMKHDTVAFLFRNLSDDVRRWANGEALSLTGLLDSVELSVLSARPMQGNYGEALLKLRPALFDGENLFFRYPELIADLGRAYQYTPSFREEGAGLLKSWAAILEGQKEDDTNKESKFFVNFYAGRIERDRTQYAESTECFKRALKYAPNDLQSDACHWYMLMNTLAGSPAAAMRQALADMSQWKDMDYFSDVLDSLAYNFTARRQWDNILELFYGLEAIGTGRSLAQYAWIAGRAVQEGYIKTERGVDSFFRIAFAQGKDYFYYRAMAASALGVPFAVEEGKSSDGIQNNSGPGSELEFLLGFFEYGASDFAYPYIQSAEKDLSTAELRKVAEALTASGRWKNCLDLVSRYTSRKDYELAKQDLFLLFPQPYKELIEKYSGEAELGAEILYGLIRTESYFVSDVVSRSGAVGLVQLMAPTAEDMAGRIARSGGPDYRVPEINLKDPETSIHIGSYYMRYLIAQMGNPMLALLAYNGGLGRVRRWLATDGQRTGGGLPHDLFLESVEFSETREYGRQVLSAASVYGHLYYGMGMEETAADIYRQR
jgi:soluble lytic murein transglycosylase